MSATNTTLNVKNLNQYYGGSHILRDLSFTAEAGKVTTILGRNGVGKSTLLKSLMGMVPTKSGSIEFAGRDLTAAPRTSGSRPASAMCRRGARSSRA
jgi:urea transport system ATP-binding protein